MLRLVFLVLSGLAAQALTLNFSYHTHEQMGSYLKSFKSSYPALSTRLVSIGKSVKGRDLWAMKVSGSKGLKIGTPHVKLIANIHGNEPTGREILLHLLEHLGDNYGHDSDITWLLDNTRIHVLPSMNPDGFSIATESLCKGDLGRSNARNRDLNRNFPHTIGQNYLPPEAETKAIVRWMENVPFILSASLHGGALVANYPYDTVKEETSAKINPPSLSPDDDVFVHLARTYSRTHPTMHLGLTCPDSKKFPEGITNGAAWYPFRGGMQDYNYFFRGCMEVTLEINCCKYPPSRDLPKLWEENREALIEFIKQAHRGVRGIILDAGSGKPIENATLKIDGREINFTSFSTGEFWRILLPGNYSLLIRADGYHPETVKFQVPEPSDYQHAFVAFNISLTNSSTPLSTSTTLKSTTTLRVTSTDNNYVQLMRDQSKEQENSLPSSNKRLSQMAEKRSAAANSAILSSRYLHLLVLSILIFLYMF